MTRAKFVLVLLGVAAVMPAGCQRGPRFVPVEGTVTFGGKPLAGAIVEFYPEPGTVGPRSRSEATDAAGHYRLRGVRDGTEGAVVGSHRVCVLDVRNQIALLSSNALNRLPQETQKKVARLKQAEAASPQIPPHYSHQKETPLRVEVRPETQVIDLEIK